MISSLHGTVLHAALDRVILDVNGVGFSVAVPPDVARTAREGEHLRLHTSLIVREDAMSLFGFASIDELEAFGALLGVSGVGPKSALGVLSQLTIDQIADAVAAEDAAPFRKVSGIGPKTAKLIVVQLQGKIHPTVDAPGAASSTTSDVEAQVAQALTGLGWPERVAAEAVSQAAQGASDVDRSSVSALLRVTLATLGPAAGAGARG